MRKKINRNPFNVDDITDCKIIIVAQGFTLELDTRKRGIPGGCPRVPGWLGKACPYGA